MVTEHTIGGRIRALREYRKLRQQDMASALNIASSAYRNYEYGNTTPHISTLEALADYFDVSIDYLVRGVTPSGENINMYRETGLNDAAIDLLVKGVEKGKERGGLDEYKAAINAIVTGGLPSLALELRNLNKKLAEIRQDWNEEIEKKLEEKLEDKRYKILAETTELELNEKDLDDIELDETERIEIERDIEDSYDEKIDFFIWQYLESVKKVFEKLIIKP